MAFQIADDVLDLVGDEATVGKSLGTDLLKQKATLPLIRLLGSSARSERAELMSLSVPTPTIIIARPCGRGSSVRRPPYAREKAQWFTRRAGQRLSPLPPSAALHSLLGLTDFVVNRQQ